MRRVAFCLTLTILFTACGHQAEAQPVSSRPTTLSSPVSSSCDRACWLQRIEQQQNERIYWAEVVKQQKAAAAYRRLLAFAAAVERARRAQARPVEVCNGRDLPPCWVVHRESRYDPRAENPTSSASGLYQFLDRTFVACPHHGRWTHASWAPVSVQVACARWLWAGGRGRSHWSL